MSRIRRSRTHRGFMSAGGAALLALLLAALPYSAVAHQGNPEAQRHLDNAISALSSDQPDPQVALEEVDKVLELEPANAQAYYYRGMAYGQVQRLQEALDAFVTAGELSPGYTDAHVWACRLAFQFQNWEVAWDQGILASQSGFDMSQAFAELRRLTDEPTDFDKRLRAPRILLGGVDVEAITGQDSFLNEPVSIGNVADAGSRGDAASPSSASLAFADGASGGSRFAEAQADIANVRRTFGVMLQESDEFAVVQRPDLATYVLTLKINDVGLGRPRDMEGIVKLMRGEQEMYSHVLRLTDIASTSDLRSQIFRQVVFMEEWLAKQAR